MPPAAVGTRRAAPLRCGLLARRLPRLLELLGPVRIPAGCSPPGLYPPLPGEVLPPTSLRSWRTTLRAAQIRPRAVSPQLISCMAMPRAPATARAARRSARPGPLWRAAGRRLRCLMRKAPLPLGPLLRRASTLVGGTPCPPPALPTGFPLAALGFGARQPVLRVHRARRAAAAAATVHPPVAVPLAPPPVVAPAAGPGPGSRPAPVTGGDGAGPRRGGGTAAVLPPAMGGLPARQTGSTMARAPAPLRSQLQRPLRHPATPPPRGAGIALPAHRRRHGGVRQRHGRWARWPPPHRGVGRSPFRSVGAQHGPPRLDLAWRWASRRLLSLPRDEQRLLPPRQEGSWPAQVHGPRWGSRRSVLGRQTLGRLPLGRPGPVGPLLVLPPQRVEALREELDLRPVHGPPAVPGTPAGKQRPPAPGLGPEAARRRGQWSERYMRPPTYFQPGIGRRRQPRKAKQRASRPADGVARARKRGRCPGQARARRAPAHDTKSKTRMRSPQVLDPRTPF